MRTNMCDNIVEVYDAPCGVCFGCKEQQRIERLEVEQEKKSKTETIDLSKVKAGICISEGENWNKFMFGGEVISQSIFDALWAKDNYIQKLEKAVSNLKAENERLKEIIVLNNNSADELAISHRKLLDFKIAYKQAIGGMPIEKVADICKLVASIGENVFYIYLGELREGKILYTSISEDSIYLTVLYEYQGCSGSGTLRLSYTDNEVFLTKEEAEARLKILNEKI